jgi:drug/metabolite transporter (DMT)-like permease
VQRRDDCLPEEKIPRTASRYEKIRPFLLLHVLLLLYSAGGICSKFAAAQDFLSLPFLRFYAGVLICLVVYAIGWQQVLRKMSLTTAFANKSVVFIWTFLWGMIFFSEKLTPGMIIGAILVIAGILLVVSDHG